MIIDVINVHQSSFCSLPSSISVDTNNDFTPVGAKKATRGGSGAGGEGGEDFDVDVVVAAGVQCWQEIRGANIPIQTKSIRTSLRLHTEGITTSLG